MRLCMYMYVAKCCPCAHHACSLYAIIDMAKIVSVDRVLTLNVHVAHQQLKPEERLFEAQADLKETKSKEEGDRYTRVVSSCSNKATFMISVSDMTKPVVYSGIASSPGL